MATNRVLKNCNPPKRAAVFSTGTVSCLPLFGISDNSSRHVHLQYTRTTSLYCRHSLSNRTRGVLNNIATTTVLSYISEYSTDIHHVSGKDNTMADGLSRPFAIATATWTHNGLDPHKLTEGQASDPDLTAATDSSLRLEQVQFDQHFRLWCDTSCRVPLPYLPPAWCRPTFDKLHSLSHPSIRATRLIVRSGRAPASAARLPKYRDTQGRHGSSSSFLVDVFNTSTWI